MKSDFLSMFIEQEASGSQIKHRRTRVFNKAGAETIL